MARRFTLTSGPLRAATCRRLFRGRTSAYCGWMIRTSHSAFGQLRSNSACLLCAHPGHPAEPSERSEPDIQASAPGDGDGWIPALRHDRRRWRVSADSGHSQDHYRAAGTDPALRPSTFTVLRLITNSNLVGCLRGKAFPATAETARDPARAGVPSSRLNAPAAFPAGTL
jgi:hypothetical protein